MIKRFVFTVLGTILMLLPAVAQATNTYATFDSGFCNAGLTLTNGNLTVTHAGANAWQSCGTTIGKSSGKWYFEITDDIQTVNVHMVCVENSTAGTGNYFSVGADGWCYWSDGSKQTNNAGAGYGATYTTGDVIGVYFDADADTLGFTKNGVDQGQAYTGVTGTLYGGVSMFDVASKMSGNFGATALTYSPPSGYNAGLYNSSGGGVVIPFSFFDIF